MIGKKQLLKPHQEDMFIEMEEIRPQYKYQEGRESQTYKYYKLQEKEAEHAASHNNLRIQQLPVSEPFNPKIITMNGATFRLIQRKKPTEKVQRKKLPTMLVSCFMCINVQSVPGTIDTFRCGSCNNINQCVPVYALLRCYHCNAKVCFVKGISDFIKCTRCNSVNEVEQEIKKVQSTAEEPHYKVHYDKKLTVKGDSLMGKNPYAGTLEKEYELEELLSVDEMTSYEYPEL